MKGEGRKKKRIQLRERRRKRRRRPKGRKRTLRERRPDQGDSHLILRRCELVCQPTRLFIEISRPCAGKTAIVDVHRKCFPSRQQPCERHYSCESANRQSSDQ